MSQIALNLAKRVSFVSGSTSGIGLAIARTLAAQGSAVVLNGFGEAQTIQSLVRNIESDYGVPCIFNSADMTSRDQIHDMVKIAQRDLGSLDIVVNNAGRQHLSPVVDFDDDMWDAITNLNLTSNFHVTKAALPGMIERGYGRIINVSSVHGLVASKNKSAYVAAKHGVIGLTKTTALETATEPNITCNAVCPGWVLTPLVQAQVDARAEQDNSTQEEAKAALLGEKQPSMQFVDPDELGALVAFLCSDHARNITGAAIPVDGGWLAQ